MKTTEKKLLSNEEIASFCSQTAMLFQAGIPPMEGMAILQSDAGSPEGKAIFDEILTVCRQGESFEEYYIRADKALYYVKQNGKNNYRFYEELVEQ